MCRSASSHAAGVAAVAFRDEVWTSHPYASIIVGQGRRMGAGLSILTARRGRRRQREASSQPARRTRRRAELPDRLDRHRATSRRPRSLPIVCARIAVSSASLGIQSVIVVDNASRTFAHPCRDSGLCPRQPSCVTRPTWALHGPQTWDCAARPGRYLLLLNPDTVLATDSLELMVDYMDAHPDVGARDRTPRAGRWPASILPADARFPTPMRSLYRITLLSRLFPTQPALRGSTT